jgi:hypothetical protein
MVAMNESVIRPFKSLGGSLKTLREKNNESVAEVSGAVEIDVEELESIENGFKRPSEDILMLLINHFGMQDNDAVRLWQLAGYDHGAKAKDIDDGQANFKQVVMLLTLDSRVVYSDGVGINVDPSGVVLNFTQGSELGERLPISRVGMSIDQAEHLSDLLQKALLKIKYVKGPKSLPASIKIDKDSKKTK